MVQHTDALDAGTELELTYNGQQGSRTIPVEVVDVTPRLPSMPEYDEQRIRVRDLDRGDRYLQFDVDADGTWSYETVRTESTKGGRRPMRLGELEDWQITGEAGVPHADKLAAVSDADEGDRLRVTPEGDADAFTATVVGNDPDSSFTRLETDDGDRHSLCCNARGVTHNNRPASVEHVGRNDRADEAAPAVAQSWVRGLREGQAVELGDITMYVVRQHAATAVSLADEYRPDEYQGGSVTLTADCLGLRLGNISEGYERIPTREVLLANDYTEATFGDASIDGEA